LARRPAPYDRARAKPTAEYRAPVGDQAIGTPISFVWWATLELWQGRRDPAKASEADFATVRNKLDAAGSRSARTA